MSCFTCHTLHQSADDPRERSEWTEDQLLPEMRGNAACLSCHHEYSSTESLVAHTHHPPESAGSVCYNCHMPNTTYGLLKATRSHRLNSPSVAETLHAGRPTACNLCHLDRSLKWTDEKLVEWYGHTPTPLSARWADVAVSVEMALAGDAAQRALIAWHMGWDAARQASGDDWFTPYLTLLMTDNYAAVRLIAHRSLKQLGASESVVYDSEMPATERERAAQAITEQWQAQSAVRDRPELLIAPSGELDRDRATQILLRRDHTPIELKE
jgi:hypothetical protein